ncbi:GNAT family N-acetyltransferase [Methylophaga nitratireducenticrescens]|uniref:ElaA protein n=1 Tax=Methylophaga nitratireducenticrescens TaxID=754476 RepID=I1XMD9_METNJ|nr:GNAT family N-acetyltransferase [Methylophaga nitratireducenticrescens]AFI85558.1 GNAT family N-acetyltransferase [Methylophaga nitratireducenticrescens]AUZ85295.1 GNAT family N-acetyltransferase [Methylophaga nitratireducenticrescens]
MKLEFKWSRLESFTASELYEVIKARESVFVVEQHCPYQETDELDPYAWHLSALVNGELAAYARVVDPGIDNRQPSIGRVMTLKKFRGQKIGRTLMEEALKFTEQKYPGKDIKISAQVYLQKFYGSLGFHSSGEPYDEDGILHVDMIMSVNKS